MSTLRGAILTWANLLTAIRLASIPLIVVVILHGRWLEALALFVLAAVTDLLDGPAARRFNQQSAFGGVFDHATDALFVTGVLAASAVVHVVPGILPVLIPAAFLQYSLDSRVLAGHELRTSAIGRLNGIAYFVLSGTVIVRESLGFDWLPLGVVAAFGWLLVATTAVSMLDRWLTWRRVR